MTKVNYIHTKFLHETVQEQISFKNFESELIHILGLWIRNAQPVYYLLVIISVAYLKVFAFLPTPLFFYNSKHVYTLPNEDC